MSSTQPEGSVIRPSQSQAETISFAPGPPQSSAPSTQDMIRARSAVDGVMQSIAAGVSLSGSGLAAASALARDLLSEVPKAARVSEPFLGLPTDDKARKELQLWTFLMGYFPDTFIAVANVAIAGNKQHNAGEPLHWAREKSTDQMNTAFRHQFDYGRGVIRDTDGQYHLAKAIWRLSAELQLLIERERNA